ncbi:MAG: hypothetical protein HC925_08475 [Coleofasciculaceae cyanobacterium SM2_3_26]|nr:hypothetical protein [Coleofasciculaceae cyanobacterium SM2_3_26]
MTDHIAFLEAELRLAKTEILMLRQRQGLPLQSNGMEEVALPLAKAEKLSELTLAERELYRVVGELAFVVAKADNVLRASEREAFYKVIVEDFGKDSWLVGERFKIFREKHQYF